MAIPLLPVRTGMMGSLNPIGGVHFRGRRASNGARRDADPWCYRKDRADSLWLGALMPFIWVYGSRDRYIDTIPLLYILSS